MFTGLVQSLAEVTQLEPVGPSVRLRLSEPKIASHASIGDSIAINGCCLTVVAINGDKLSFDAGEETLSRTTLGSVKAGDRVNVESSLRMGDLLGGHWFPAISTRWGSSMNAMMTPTGQNSGSTCRQN
jgi:riboflavin synthase